MSYGFCVFVTGQHMANIFTYVRSVDFFQAVHLTSLDLAIAFLFGHKYY